MRGVARIGGVLAFAVAACLSAPAAFGGTGVDHIVAARAGAPTNFAVDDSWSNDTAPLTLNFGSFTGDMHVLHDATNLYIGIRVNDPSTAQPKTAIYFDNTDSGFLAAGDNEVEFNGDTFLDQSATGAPGFAVTPDAHVDGSAIQSLRDGNATWHIIYVIPLCGSDPTQDFCIHLPAYGQDAVRLGFTLVYNGQSYPTDPASVAGYGNFIFPAPTTPPPPPVPTVTLTNGDGREYLKQVGDSYLVYFNQSLAGAFTLGVPQSDSPAGIASAAFPSTLFDANNTSQPAFGWTSGNNQDTALQKSYQFVAQAAQPTSFGVTSTDTSGQTSPPRTVGFQPDANPPTGSISCQPIGCSNTDGPVRVTVHVSDGVSGVRQIAYRTDGGAVFDGGTPIADGGSFLVTAPGATVKVGAIDNVGNRNDSLATAAVSGAPAPANMTWNYATDFQDQTDPGPDLYGNPNVWSYGEIPIATQHSLSTSTVYSRVANISNERCWLGQQPDSDGISPDACVLPGTVPPGTDVDPASTRDTFINWTSPITGNVKISGGFSDADTACGDGINWFVDHNGSTLASGTAFNNSSAFPSSLDNVSVTAGDSLTFLVGPGPAGDFFCDSTRADITITQLAADTAPVVQSVGGATGIVGQAAPVLQISYTDPECNVTGGTWEGATGSGLSQDFPVTGGCSAGSGVATFTRSCLWYGRWTEYITLVDATGLKSERFPFTYRCVAATSTAPTILGVSGASGTVGGAPVSLSINYNDPECDVILGTWEGPSDSGLSGGFYTPQPTSCNGGNGTAPYTRAACQTAGQSTEYITLEDSLGNRSQRFAYTLTCALPDSTQPGPTYTVNTASDHTDSTGCTVADCSLAEAIDAANRGGVAAIITFAIVSEGRPTIALLAPLPHATVPIGIDGTTEPGVLTGPGVALDGSGIDSSNRDGIVLDAESSTVRGLALENFGGNAIVVNGDGAHIAGNVIGTTPDGTGLRANGGDIVVSGSSRSQITGNLISGSNHAGILVTGFSSGTIIQANKIGTDANGDFADEGNVGPGVQISSDSPNNLVGGTVPIAGNRIADNGGPAVLVASSGNPILGNSIEANGGGGIDLGDTGNQLQPAPLIAFARVSGNSLNVIGKFLTPAGTYRLEYFLNPSCPETGLKEGATFIGTSQVIVNGGGEAAVNATLDISNVSPNAGSLLTATATNASSESLGNTSEFSNRCISLSRGGTATAATLSLSAETGTDSANTPPGASVIPLSAIPPSAFGNTSTDSNGATVSAPLGAIPLGAIPLGAIPLGAIPLGAIPLGAIGFTQQTLVQDGLGGVPLNTIPLKAPLSWETELHGTPLEGVPAQTLTLKDVLGLASPPSNLVTPGPNAIGLKDLDLSLSPLGAIPLGAIALGASPLGAIPINGGTSTAANIADWCTQIKSLPGFGSFDCTGLGTQTVMGVAIQGVPLGAIPLGAIPLGAIPLGAIPLGAIPLGAIDLANSPLGAIPLGAIDLANTPLGAIPLGAIPLGAIPLGAIPLGAIPLGAIPLLVDCTHAFSCTGKTLADAYAAGAVKSTATLADLGTYGAATLRDLATYLQAHPEIQLKNVVPGLPNTVTLRDLLAALMGGTPPSWEQFPLGGLQDFASSGGLVTYSAGFRIDGTGSAAVATVNAAMPAGARYVAGSANLLHTSGTTTTTTPVNDPTINGSALSWTLDSLSYGDNYTLKFQLRPGFQLGNEQTKVTLATTGVADQSKTADVTVVDTFESNDTPATAAPIAPASLYISYLGNGKDVDYSKLHIDPGSAPAGTRIRIFLSHLHSDADLAVYGPAETPLRSAPLGAIPLGAIAAGDQTVQLGQANQALTPDTAQDLPFGALPAGNQLLGVSDNRGTADEEVDLTSTGQTGDLYIQVSSYDGHPTTDPYVVRVQEDLPPALPPCTQTAPTGGPTAEAPMPALTATTQTLILFNEHRLGAYYPSADMHALYLKLQAYAARSDVNGAIVPVESDPAVATAYANWDANLCSPSAANNVVRKIGLLLDTLQNGHPNLKSVVVVGADHIIPFGRLLDQTQQANELGFRSTFGFVNNEYVGAVAAGYLLSDDPYADRAPSPLLGGSLYVPRLALGRLVETPDDISRQLVAYSNNNGLVNPQTKLVTGYDFLSDGAQAVNAALRGTIPSPNLISDSWTANDVRGALFPLSGAGGLVDSLNAHYDQHRALSAQGNAIHDESPASLFTTTDIAAKGATGVLGRIVFTMGCHAGFSLFDGLSYFTSGQPTDFALDWPQAYMEGGAIEFMGNTGFGLGDTVAVAYSERLNQLFAQRLNGTMTIGEALQYAKQEYFGDLGVVTLYDAKVGNEATLYGLPTYRLGTGTPPAPPTVPPTHTDPATSLASLDFVVNPTFTLHPSATLGNYYSANDPNGLGTQVTNRRPIEPLTSLDITQPNLTAHGVLLTSLVSHDVTPLDFHAAFARVADDSSLIEPQLLGVVDFPASIQSLATIATPNGQRQRAILIAGHFASGPASGVGRQRLYDTLRGTVLYSTSADFTRPTIRNMQVLQVGSSVGFEATIPDTDLKEALVLYLDGSGLWQRADLTCDANGRCIGGGPLTGTSVDYIAEAVDSAGNVAINAHKASTTNVAPAAGSQHLSVSFNVTPSNGWFRTAPVVATLSSDNGSSLSFSVDGGEFHAGTSVSIAADGLHTLDVRGSDGSAATFAVPIDTTSPTIQINQPTAGMVILSGDVFRADFSCSDTGGSGLAAPPDGCKGTVANGSPISATAGTQTFTVTAKDNAGNTATKSVTYTVWQWTGFNQPVDNPPTLNSVNAGQAVPVKFALGGNRGLSPFGSSYPASVKVACATDVPIDVIETTVTAGSSGMQYDAGSNSYTYVWKTDKAWSGTCRDLILQLPSGSFRKAQFKFK